MCGGAGSSASTTVILSASTGSTIFSFDRVKQHAVPPCLVLVIDDNLYGLMVALSYI